MKFVWDENKNKINIQKHGISFERAAYIFEDPNYIEDYDEIHSFDEDRYRIIGMVDQVLCVIVTYREKDTVRIISARKATQEERSAYYGNSC